MKITRRQLRRIINEALPPHLQKHFRSDGSSVNDPEWEDVTPAGYGPDDTAAPPQKLKVGDLVRSVDYRGDGWGGDFERIMGNFPGTIIDIDNSEDGPIQYVVNWPAGEPTMVSADELELIKEAKMKITKRQLGRIIGEALDTHNMSANRAAELMAVLQEFGFSLFIPTFADSNSMALDDALGAYPGEFTEDELLTAVRVTQGRGA